VHSTGYKLVMTIVVMMTMIEERNSFRTINLISRTVFNPVRSDMLYGIECWIIKDNISMK
jgi:hypothetical protein